VDDEVDYSEVAGGLVLVEGSTSAPT